MVVLREEGADAPLHRDIEPDRGLVEEEDARTVEERSRHLALHPFPQRQVAHGLVQERRQIEQLDQLVERLAKDRRLEPIDRAVSLERVDHRNVPEQLVALAHHQRDLAQEVAIAPGRDVREDVDLTAGGMQQAPRAS